MSELAFSLLFQSSEFVRSSLDEWCGGTDVCGYSGVYVATAVLWFWGVEGKSPDQWDLLGSAVSIVGMAIIMFGPRPS